MRSTNCEKASRSFVQSLVESWDTCSCFSAAAMRCSVGFCRCSAKGQRRERREGEAVAYQQTAEEGDQSSEEGGGISNVAHDEAGEVSTRSFHDSVEEGFGAGHQLDCRGVGMGQ